MKKLLVFFVILGLFVPIDSQCMYKTKKAKKTKKLKN